MKNIRGFALTVAFSLATSVSALAFVYGSTPADKTRKTETCCAMESCCKSDSCDMMKHKQNDAAKSHSDHDGCCCSGDSCDMKMKEKETKQNHAKTS